MDLLVSPVFLYLSGALVADMETKNVFILSRLSVIFTDYWIRQSDIHSNVQESSSFSSGIESFK